MTSHPDPDLASQLAAAFDRTRALILDLAFSRNLARSDRDLARDLARAVQRARAKVSDLAGILDRAQELADDSDFAREPKCLLEGLLDRVQALDLYLDRAFDLDGAHELGSAIDLAELLASDLDAASTHALGRRNPGRGRAGGSGRVGRSARRLASAAARLLPAADRARYAEEYRSELWELAQAGESRRRQAAYGLRQLRSALALRGELQAPRRRQAAP
jgi:hypothetical protein